MILLLVLLSLLALITVIAPHLPGKHWLIRLWEFPRVQLVTFFLLLAGIWLVVVGPQDLLSQVFVALLLTATAYELVWIVPYTPLWRTEVKRTRQQPAPYPHHHETSPHATDPGPSLSLITSNVLMDNDNYQGLIDLVEQYQPDMLITLETNEAWQRNLEPLHSDYPHRLACPLENLYGMHLYSRLPFKHSEIRFIVEQDVPSMQITISVNDQDVVVYFLHPKPPSPTENETAGPRDAELTIVGREVAKQTLPVIVAGDLNDVAWSPTTRHFRHISGALDPRRGRGFFNTFHASYPFIRWPLDHVFHSAHFTLSKLQRLPGFGSDHFPLYTELELESGPNGVSSSDRQTEKS